MSTENKVTEIQSVLHKKASAQALEEWASIVRSFFETLEAHPAVYNGSNENNRAQGPFTFEKHQGEPCIKTLSWLYPYDSKDSYASVETAFRSMKVSWVRDRTTYLEKQFTNDLLSKINLLS